MADTGLQLVLRACASVTYDEGGTPSFILQSGDFLDAFVVNATGDIEVAFVGGFGVDLLGAVVVTTPRAALAASGLVTIATTRPTDQRIRFMTLQEQAAGAASAAADVPFDFQVWSLPGR